MGNELQIFVDIEPQDININDIVDMFITEQRLKIDNEIADLKKQLPTKEMLIESLKEDFINSNKDTIDFFKKQGYSTEICTNFLNHGYEMFLYETNYIIKNHNVNDDNMHMRMRMNGFGMMVHGGKFGLKIYINCSLIISKNNISQILHLDDTKYTTYDNMRKFSSEIDNTISKLRNKQNNISNKKQDILAEITKMKLKNSVEGREFLESLNII